MGGSETLVVNEVVIYIQDEPTPKWGGYALPSRLKGEDA